MCHLSTVDDPTRTSWLDVPYEALRDWLAMILKMRLENGRDYSCPPYHRGHMPPRVSIFFSSDGFFLKGFFVFLIFPF